MVARKKRTPVVASAMSRPQQVSENLDAAGKGDNDDEEGLWQFEEQRDGYSVLGIRK